MNHIKRIITVTTLVGVLIVGCDQYEYSSPTPGVIQLNFRAKYSQFEASDSAFRKNNFTVTIADVKAVRDDGARANIYQDVKAIIRKPNAYNLLGQKAYDSMEVFGNYPIPPGTYTRLELLMQPAREVFLDGYRRIRVERPPESPDLIVINTPFRIEEGRTTMVVITADLDILLERLAYTYGYRPYKILRLNLNSPNGGEQWEVDSNRTIRWTSTYVDTVSLEFSANDGISWQSIVRNIPAALEVYTWKIPNNITDRARVRIIADTPHGQLRDRSDSPFVIKSVAVKSLENSMFLNELRTTSENVDVTSIVVSAYFISSIRIY